MKTIRELEQLFSRAKQSGNEDERGEFLEELGARHDQEALGYHLSLLRDRSDMEFYLDLRAAFEEHGEPGEKFLLASIGAEAGPSLKADMLLLLGLMDSPAASELASKFAGDPDPEIRENAAAVLGWLGSKQSLRTLETCLLQDGQEEVRASAAAAMRQVWYRIPGSASEILQAYEAALDKETSELAAAVIIVSAQTMLKARFGLREDTETGQITGDWQAARIKALRKIRHYLGIAGNV